MKIKWTAGAADDLEEIVDYIRRDRPDAAQRVAKLIYDSIMSLALVPYKGRIREEDSSLELVIPTLPYLVLYEVIKDEIFVKAVRHTSRNWQ